MKVLISAPRTGSSYFYEYIELENIKIFGVQKPHQKAEFLNPGQSVKDRAALYIIKDAERKKLIKIIHKN